MKILILFAIALCAYAADIEETDKDKRQTHEGLIPTHFIYRTPRKQEQAAPVEEPQQDDIDVEKDSASRADNEEYRPGQVFSLNPQELLELQQERKAPVSNTQLLQQLYNSPQQDSKQSLQQFYYLEPQVGRQVVIQPSRAVISRPNYSSNGGEASVGAALSVSDSGANSANSFDQELLALLSQAPVRQEELRQQTYTQSPPPSQSSTVQSVAPQYQQIERYVTKPSKKPTKLRTKVQIATPQIPAAPQQYLIETTNVQQQQSQQQIQPQSQLQYRPAPQQQRLAQVLRYVPFQQTPPTQQPLYERPESQGLKVVAAPKLQQIQQPRPQINYRLVPQYQPETAPKQYRIVEAPRPQLIRQDQRVQSPSVERPVTYLKRYPEPEKLRSVKIYDPVATDGQPQQPTQYNGEQYILRPLYRTNDQRARYELQALPFKSEQRVVETKLPQSAIYVSKNLAPRKLARPQSIYKEQNVKVEQPEQEQSYRLEQTSNTEQVNIEQHGQNLDEQRVRLPPPRNNKAYTPEEFAALVAAGYAVTPVPVGGLNLDVAQSRSAVEAVTPQPQRRVMPSRRNQYLPLRGDDAP